MPFTTASKDALQKGQPTGLNISGAGQWFDVVRSIPISKRGLERLPMVHKQRCRHGVRLRQLAIRSTSLIGSTTERSPGPHPVVDIEPPYVNAPHYKGQQNQERANATTRRSSSGGAGINFGQRRKWWPHGVTGLFDGGPNWLTVINEPPQLCAKYAWKLVDTYVQDVSWKPDNGTFLKTGLLSGDDKAASGYSRSAGVVYFPTNRSITVDTTAITGGQTVKLRWYDPTTGTYTEISASEPKNSSRSVSYPSGHTDGTNDWVLVVEGVWRGRRGGRGYSRGGRSDGEGKVETWPRRTRVLQGTGRRAGSQDPEQDRLRAHSRAEPHLRPWSSTLGCGLGFDADQHGWDAYDPYYRPGKPTGAYATIIVNHVANILTRASRAELLRTVNALLAPGGVAFISVARNIPASGKPGPRRRIQNYVVLTLPSVFADDEEEIYRLAKDAAFEDRTREFEETI